MSRQLYLAPTEIEITDIPLEEYQVKRQWFDRITSHEHSGLVKSGCDIKISDTETIIDNPRNDLAFFNRITNVNMSEQALCGLLRTINPKFSFVINPFTNPSNAMQILEDYGYINCISSTVVGSEVPSDLETPTNNYEFMTVEVDCTDFDDMFAVFATFFLKPNESPASGRERLNGNLSRGTHLLVRQNGVAIGMVGTIDDNKVSSIYCGIILPEYRASNVLNALAPELSQRLMDKGICHYYGKSRNRAFLLGLKRMFGFEHLYNEKTYILNNHHN